MICKTICSPTKAIELCVYTPKTAWIWQYIIFLRWMNNFAEYCVAQVLSNRPFVFYASSVARYLHKARRAELALFTLFHFFLFLFFFASIRSILLCITYSRLDQNNNIRVIVSRHPFFQLVGWIILQRKMFFPPSCSCCRNFLILFFNPLPDKQYFMLLHLYAFWRTKSNKFAILVNFLYVV